MKLGSFTTNLLQAALVAVGLLGISSCAVDPVTGQLIFDPEAIGTETEKKPDPTSEYHSDTHHIFVDERKIDALNSGNSRIEIDLGEQRARIFKTGGGKDELVIETQISTGKQGHSTPDGNFKILEKLVDKNSTLYGKWVDGAGNTIISDGDSRKPPKDKSARFKGTAMPYWMRITPGGIGMHIGYVPNVPASHGCIRVPRQVQPLIFSKTRVGTPVKISH